MSTRVYLSKHTCQTTPQEDTPVCIRIQLSRATVNDLHKRLQHAYQRDDVRLVRRITVLLDLLVEQVPMAVLCARWGLSLSCLYTWQKALLLRGMDSLVYRHGGGRRPKLTLRQKKRLVELIEAGPLVVGFETACWNSVLIRVLIWRRATGHPASQPLFPTNHRNAPSAEPGCRTRGRRLYGRPRGAKV